MSELHCIESAHVERLRAVASRLYTEQRLNGDEMRDLAHAIMTVVDFAKDFLAPEPDTFAERLQRYGDDVCNACGGAGHI